MNKHLAASVLALLCLVSGMKINAVPVEGNIVGNVDISMDVKQGSPVVNIPLLLPRLIDGLNPTISINYKEGLNTPVLGYGFYLSGLREIKRCQKNMDDDGEKGFLKADEDNYCINGHRIVKRNNGYYYKVINARSRFSRLSDSQWKEETSDGFVHYYKSRHSGEAGNYSWSIEKTEKVNSKGSVIYQYAGSYYQKIKSIDYGHYSVRFIYENSGRTYRNGRYGSYFEDSERIKNITVYRNDERIKEYSLGYENTGNNYALEKVGLCFENDQSCLKSARLTYDKNARPNPGWMVKKDTVLPSDMSNPANVQIKIKGDINADGIVDFCSISLENSKLYCNVNEVISEWLDISGLVNVSTIRQLWLSGTEYVSKDSMEKELNGLKNVVRWLDTSKFIDIDNDGYSDFCFYYDDSMYCSKNNDGKSLSLYQKVADYSGFFSEDKPELMTRVSWFDINNDSYPDFCTVSSNKSNSKNRYNNKIVCFDNTKSFGFSLGEKRFNSKETLFSPFLYSEFKNLNSDKFPDFCYISANFIKHRNIFDNENFIECLPLIKKNYSYLKKTVFKGKLYPDGKYGGNKKDIESLNDFKMTVRVVDVNNDGIDDLCYLWINKPECIINSEGVGNTGRKIKSDVVLFDIKDDVPAETKRIIKQSLTFDDWNDDGEVDVCWLDFKGFNCAYGNQGKFSSANLLFEVPLSDKGVFKLKVRTMVKRRIVFFKFMVRFRSSLEALSRLNFGPVEKLPDSNGNGLSEFCYQYEGYTNCHDLPASTIRIKSVENSLGAVTSVEYKSSSDSDVYKIESTDKNSYDNTFSNPERMLVSRLVVDNGLSNSLKSDAKNIFDYQYKNFIYNAGRGKIGFKFISVHDVVKHKKTEIEFNTKYPYYGLISEEKTLFNNVLKKIEKKDYKKVSGINSSYPVLYKSISNAIEGSVTREKVVNYKAHDEWGYATLIETDVSISSSAYKHRLKKEIKYKHLTASSYITGLPEAITSSYSDSNGDEKVTREINSYDSMGRIVSKVRSATGAKENQTFYDEYNTIGLPEKITHKDTSSNEERVETYDYDEDSKQLVSKSNALGHQTTYQYTSESLACQKPASVTDPNGLKISYSYDGLCRTVKENRPDGHVVDFQWQWDKSLHRGIGSGHASDLDISAPSVYKAIESHRASASSQTSVRRTIAYKDMLGRTLRKVVEGDAAVHQCSDNEGDIFTDYAYDRLGNLAGETRPYYSCIKGSVYNDQVWMVSKFDNRDRKTEYQTQHENKPVKTTFKYQDNKVLKYYQGQLEKTTAYGVHQKPDSVESRAGKIEFRYDSMGNLIKVTRNQLVTEVKFDARGNKLSVTDPDRGHWQYQYNAFDELIWQKDANGTITHIKRDRIGRVKEKAAGSEYWRWEYDPDNAKGNIKAETSNTAKTNYYYDSLSRVQKSQLAVGGKSYVTKFHYNELNQVIKEEHPSGIHILKEYDYLGRISAFHTPKAHIRGYSARVGKAIERSLALLKAGKERLQAIIDRHYEKAKKQHVVYLTLINNIKTLKEKRVIQKREYEYLKDSLESLKERIEKNENHMNFMRKKQQEMLENGFNKILNIAKNHGYKIDLGGGDWGKKTSIYYISTTAGLAALGKSGVRGTATREERVQDTSWTCKVLRQCHSNYETIAVPGINPYKYYAEVANYYSNLVSRQHSDRTSKKKGKKQTKAEIDQLGLDIDQKIKDASQAEQTWKEYSREEKAKRDQMAATMNSISILNEAKAEIKKADNEGRALIWKATHYQANGMLQSEIFGNALSSEREFDPGSGRVTRIVSSQGGSTSGSIFRDLNYGYDDRGNVVKKHDPVFGDTQTYGYNDRNNADYLTDWTWTNGKKTIKESYAYDLEGNMTPSYLKGLAFNNDTHRITRHPYVSTYKYDKNGNTIETGNTTSGKPYQYGYHALSNKPNKIVHTNFDYHVNGRLLKQYSRFKYTYYVSPGVERLESIGVNKYVIWRHHLSIGDEVVATIEKEEDKDRADRVAFIHRDLQGNPDRVRGLSGQVVKQIGRKPNGNLGGARNFVRNPYGRLVQYEFHPDTSRNSATLYENIYSKVFKDKTRHNESASARSALKGLVMSQMEKDSYQNGITRGLRGYRSHLHLHDYGLVYMNARLYSPELGRFISADSMVPDPEQWGDYNRYAYARNNPMRYRDPSGHSPEEVTATSKELDDLLAQNRSLPIIHKLLGLQYLNTLRMIRHTSADKSYAHAGEDVNGGQVGYSSDRGGWHDYTEGPNLVCAADSGCTQQEMVDQFSRFAVPGQDPSKPVSDGGIYKVYDPRNGLYAGKVVTTVSDDGITITNSTLPGHVFHDGQITRSLSMDASGAWYVTTRGIGNNYVPFTSIGCDTCAAVNSWQGRKIFNYVDSQMRVNIEAHHR